MKNKFDDYNLDKPFMDIFMPCSEDSIMTPAIERNIVKPNFMNNNANKFADPMTGFKLGNLQSSTYIPYKNYKPIEPVITNQRQAELYKVQEMCFAAHELNLYLDTHPEDMNAIRLYNEYNKKANELEMAYERKYGPINLSDNIGLENMPWAWIKNPWPWNK
jgi:spore coat protein JB